MRHFLYPLAALLALQLAPSARADVDLRVGAGAGCNFATIQQAINAASNSAAVFTNIKIARNVAHTAQQLNITSKNVRLIGGFADCNQVNPDATRTVINGSGGAANTVITLLGTSTSIGFYHLEIVGGDEVTTSSGKGGGVAIGGGPHALVYFEDTWIHDNQAGYGGGLWVENENSSSASNVFIWLGHNTRIYSNFGAYGGGGVWCRNAKVDMTGGVSATVGSAIYQNSTADVVNGVPIKGSGGGIRAENCEINIATRHPSAALGTISLNVAGGNGGGISVSGERSIVNLYVQDAARATSVLLNEAGGVGGGIDVGSSARVNAYDVIVGGNTAHLGGGGISVFDNDDPPGATVVMQGSLAGAPNVAGSPEGVAVNCNSSLLCNRIANNQAINSSGNLPGAAARVSAEGSIVQGGSIGSATLYLTGTQISDNSGESLLYVLSPSNGNPEIYANGALMVENSVSGVLLHNPSESIGGFPSGRLYVDNSTIAGNAIGGNEVFRSTDLFQLKRSIVWQPGKRALFVTNNNATASQVDYLIASDLLGIPASTHNLLADPRFENSAGGNYRPRLDSPAIDYAPAGGATTDRLPRVVDLASIANEFGAQDVGAYERQFECAADTVFCSGFDF